MKGDMAERRINVMKKQRRARHDNVTILGRVNCVRIISCRLSFEQLTNLIHGCSVDDPRLHERRKH